MIHTLPEAKLAAVLEKLASATCPPYGSQRLTNSFMSMLFRSLERAKWTCEA